MGLSRRSKAAESDTSTSSSSSSSSSSSTSKFFAFFHKKHDVQVQENKRHHGGGLKSKHRLIQYRSSFSDDEELLSPTSNNLSQSCPSPTNKGPLLQVAARDVSVPCQGVFPQRSSRTSSLQYSTRSSSESSSSSSQVSGSSLRNERRQNLTTAFDHASSTPSHSNSSSSDSFVTKSASLSLRDRDSWRESSVDEFLASFPRDLTPDVQVTCHVLRPRQSKSYIRGLLVALEFEIRATKWAAYFLQIVHTARLEKRISLCSAISIKWVICAYVQGHSQARVEHQKRVDLALQRKMTEYRVALQCVAGTPVVKFGRKGKPHATNLCVENGDTLRWTSKLLAQATHLAADGVAATTTMGKKRVKAKNAIPLASIVRVTSGPSTSVLARALHKQTLVLAEAGCTLSVVTHTRTLDLKAKTMEEREWLQRSLEFLVDLARDHERRVAQQVELTIMKRMETLAVWKYGRKGRPHKTRVFVDRFGEVSWLGRSGDSLQLDEILLVHEGQQTPVFQRARAVGFVSAAKAGHCFSLVTASRSLDIEALNEQQRDWFVVAFRYLLDKVHEKTAAMQRERAEKQLRMLQEFCSGEEHENFVRGDGDDMYYDECPPARH